MYSIPQLKKKQTQKNLLLMFNIKHYGTYMLLILIKNNKQFLKYHYLLDLCDSLNYIICINMLDNKPVLIKIDLISYLLYYNQL